MLDIDARGRVLLTGNEASGLTAGVTTVNGQDRNLTWEGSTVPGHVSRDGRALLLSKQDGNDPDYSVVVSHWTARRR